MGTLVKAKIGELEEDVRVGCLRSMRKELTGVVQGILGKGVFEFFLLKIPKKGM